MPFTPSCPACKKIINNGNFIANLAPLIEGPEASALAAAARAYSDILSGFGITASADGFDGCDQAQLLVKWIRGGGVGDADKMNEWTATIWEAIDDMAHGKMPSDHSHPNTEKASE